MDRYEEYFMDVARRTSQLSYANRLKVGAVAVKDRRIICVGFNGTLPNSSNVCEDTEGFTLPSVIHAEDNLFRFAAKHKIDVRYCSLYITHSPCIKCAEIIWANYIQEVIYETEYRNTFGLDFLNNNKIKVRKYNGH